MKLLVKPMKPNLYYALFDRNMERAINIAGTKELVGILQWHYASVIILVYI